MFRKSLPNNTIIKLKNKNNTDVIIEILDFMGSGASCLTYKVQYYESSDRDVEAKIKTLGVFKEYYPECLDTLIYRKEDHSLAFNDNTREEKRIDLLEGARTFKATYEEIAYFHSNDNNEQIKNFIVHHSHFFPETIEDDCLLIFPSALYALNVGQTLSDEKDNIKTAQEVFKIGMNLAKAIKALHNKGLLFLDLKPDNVLVFSKDYPRHIIFFDVDSFVKKEDLHNKEKNVRFSYSKGWVSPESRSYIYYPNSKNTLCDIDELSDYYNVGLVIKYLFGDAIKRVEAYDYYGYKYVVDKKAPIFHKVNPSIFKRIESFFNELLNEDKVKRTSSIDDIIVDLAELCRLSDEKQQYIIDKPSTPNPRFIGREQEIKKLHQLLSDQDLVVLNAMPGMGKSQIAKKYSMVYKNEYDKVIFAIFKENDDSIMYSPLAVETEEIEQSLIETIIKNVRIRGFDLKEISRGDKKRFYSELQDKILNDEDISSEKVLLIIDNYDVNFINKELVTGFNFKTLITSRYLELAGRTIPIEEDNKENLIKLFYTYSGLSLEKSDQHDDLIGQIIKAFKGHTMALEIVASLWTQQKEVYGEDFYKYKEIICDGLVDFDNSINIEYDKMEGDFLAIYYIRSLFNISRIKEDDSKLQILQVLSMISNKGIKKINFVNLLAEEDIEERSRISKSISHLIRLRWVQVENSSDFIYLHPLVSQLIRYDYKPNLSDIIQKKYRKNLMAGIDKENYLDLLLSYVNRIDDVNYEGIEENEFFEISTVLYHKNMYKEANKISKYALNKWKSFSHTLDYIDVLINSGNISAKLRLYEKAKQTYEIAYELLNEHIQDKAYIYKLIKLKKSIADYYSIDRKSSHHDVSMTLSYYNEILDLLDGLDINEVDGVSIYKEKAKIYSDIANKKSFMAGSSEGNEKQKILADALSYFEKALTELNNLSKSEDIRAEIIDMMVNRLALTQADASLVAVVFNDKLITGDIALDTLDKANEILASFDLKMKSALATNNFQRGHVYSKYNSWEKAIEYLKLAYDSGDLPSFRTSKCEMLLADAYVKNEQYDDALELLDKLISFYSNKYYENHQTVEKVKAIKNSIDIVGNE